MRTVFVILYLALLGLYLFVETGDSFRRRAVNKILLSSLFLFSAISGSGPTATPRAGPSWRWWDSFTPVWATLCSSSASVPAALPFW